LVGAEAKPQDHPCRGVQIGGHVQIRIEGIFCLRQPLFQGSARRRPTEPFRAQPALGREYAMTRRPVGKNADEASPAPSSSVQAFHVDPVHLSGSSELEHLLINPPPEDVRRALESWTWLGLEDLRAIAVSAFGEVFFQSPDGSVLHLDSLEGCMSLVSRTLPEFRLKLMEEEHQDALLFAGLVLSARRRGLQLSDGECYDFRIAPVLGGAMDIEQVEKRRFVAKLNVAGQMHRQIKALPPGASIDRITRSD
jgi:hypothetical protein